jgi:hypothetical protein
MAGRINGIQRRDQIGEVQELTPEDVYHHKLTEVFSQLQFSKSYACSQAEPEIIIDTGYRENVC